MKKKLYFEPPKKTNLYEYITIEYGKIRDIHIVQLGTNDKRLLEINPTLSKDIYLPLKNFHTPLSFERFDRYIAKQYKIKYTHKIIISDIPLYIPNKGEKIPSEFVLKGILNGREMFLKLSVIDLLKIDYYGFSWARANMAIKISIIAIIISTTATIISVITIIIGILSLYYC